MITVIDGRPIEIIEVFSNSREDCWWPLLCSLVSSSWEPWYVETALLADVYRRLADWRASSLRPEYKLVAAAVAFMAVVAVHRHVHGERCPMWKSLVMQRAVAVSLRSSPPSALKMQQIRIRLHGDLASRFVKVDADIALPFSTTEQTVPFPISIWGTGTIASRASPCRPRLSERGGARDPQCGGPAAFSCPPFS